MYLAVKRELQAISNAVATAGLAPVRLSHAELHHRYAASATARSRRASRGIRPLRKRRRRPTALPPAERAAA